jgi:hypothetical protein
MITSLCKRIVALYLPVLLTIPEVINFLSIDCPFASKACAISALVIDPNNFSPPAFAVIFISKALIASAVAFASATTLASLCAFCFKFSAKTFLAEEVAKIAAP